MHYGLLYSAIQTLGEEYTGIWPHPYKSRLKSVQLALILLSTLPQYLLARFGSELNARSPSLKNAVQTAVGVLETAGEVNLALFYLRGTYYDLVRRMLGLRSVSSRHTTEVPVLTLSYLGFSNTRESASTTALIFITGRIDSRPTTL